MNAKIQEANKAKVAGQIIKESDKAIQVDCEIDTHAGRRSWKVWFPKSRVEVVDGAVYVARENAWLLDAKDREIEERVGSWAQIVADMEV